MQKCILILILIFILLFLLLIAVGCSFGNDSTQENVVTQNMRWYADDVVSPDGVHYWLYHNGHGGQLVPRYGADGKIVVE